MTLKVHESFLKSLPQAFEKMVADYAAAIKDHHAKPVDPQTGQGAPPPIAPHPLVEHALKRVLVLGKPDDYVPDYEIVKDPPPPPLTFKQRQAALTLDVHHKEMDARNKILPQHKQRLMHRADAEVASVHPDKRSATHIAYINERQLRQAKLDAIDLWAARAIHDIGELTEATIDHYKLPSLPA